MFGNRVIIFSNQVEIAIKNPNEHTAGNDKIRSFIVIYCYPVLIKPLANIYNAALNTWKETLLSAVNKGGEKSDIKNNRSIAIVNNFWKIFKMCIAEILKSYLIRSLIPARKLSIK